MHAPTTTENSTTTAPVAPPADRRLDLRNLGLILAGWGLLLVLVPPPHEYPIVDDYLYAQSVRDMLNTGTFVMPGFSQANLVALTVWGTLWARLFGFSFTVLTGSTLVLAAVALCAFYGLARVVGRRPQGALFGTALLGCNPIFVHLSYSFMTDVPFLAAMLLACYGYMRGFQNGRLRWLGAAGVLAGIAFLIRQYGLLIPIAFLSYALLAALLRRQPLQQWPWRQLLAGALGPAALVGGWYLWRRDIPPTSGAVQAAVRSGYFVLQEPWLRVFLLRAFSLLPLTALCAWAAVAIPRRRWWLVPLALALVIGGMYAVDLPTETWLAVSEPPFTARLGPLTYDLPQETFSFATQGNIIQVDGIDFDEFSYAQERIWSPEAWRAISMLGLALGALLLVRLGGSLWAGLRGLRTRPALPPVAGFYLLGALIFGISLAFPGDLFDRYTLGYLPFLVLFVAAGAGQWGRRAWGYSLAALALLATFTLLAKADQMDQNNARWAAGRWVEAQVHEARVGWNWTAWGHADSERYVVSGLPQPGFRLDRRFPYRSRLSGFTLRYVLVESRLDAPPLPDATAPPAPDTGQPAPPGSP